MISLNRFSYGVLIAAALSSPFALAQSSARQFFKPHAITAAKSGGGVKAPGVVSPAVPVEFNAQEMLGLVPGEEVALALPNAKSRTVVFELAQDHGGGIKSWVGHFKDRGNDNRVFLTTGPAGSYGAIDAPEGSYRIVPGDGHDWLVDMAKEQLHVPAIDLGDDARMPPSEARQPFVTNNKATYSIGIPGVNRVGMAKATPTPLVDIDMMFVVTKSLADRLGAGLLTRLNFMVTRANTAYADSEVGINLRLVNVTVVNYTDTGTNGVALDAITPNRSQFDAATFGSIESIRSQANADMVSLLRNGDSFGGSGVAWVGSTTPNPSYMYSVTTGCVAGCESVWIHEVGHNMGNMHDRATVAWQAGGTTTYGQGAQPYAYGYAFCKSGALSCNPTITNGTTGACASNQQPECSNSDASNFSDIMAYFGGTTQGIYKFSNPAVNCKAPSGDGQDRPCGIIDTATGVLITDGSADTAKAMNTTRAPISALKPGAANLPGIIQFTNATFSGIEGGNIVFTVGRSNGSGGAVSVTYSSNSGTAWSGVDFTAANGTLSWGDGDMANKSITVPITMDSLVEGVESFSVTIANPTGGASLGYATTAAGLIIEPWPSGGTAPSGFSSAVTPTLPWAITSDSFDGTVDMVSFKSGGFVDNATGNSSTQYTGAFDAGIVAFAYRVSSYQGFGFFEFLIDGNLITQDSGDTGLWKSYSTAITAGTHTLEWRYRKTLSFGCRFVTGGTATCQDRAWIDTVSLPLQGSGPPAALTPNPTSLAFGGQSMNTSAPAMTVTLTNPLGSAVTVSSVTASANFGVSSHNCATVNPMASCMASVTFTPTAQGALNGVLTVQTSAGATTVPLNGTGEKSLVTHYYYSILRRAPEAGGKTYWESEAVRMQGLGANVNETWYAMAQFFFFSAEYTALNRDNAGFVTDLYKTFFNRDPDSGGLAYWTGQLGSGMPREVVLASFMFSSEFVSFTQAIFGSTAARAEVDMVMNFYRGLLARLPDSGGFNNWVGAFRTAQCAGAQAGAQVYAQVESISSGFANSAEYTGKGRTNAQYVGDLYNAFLRRGGDLAGVQSWINQLNGGGTRDQIRQAFISTAEFNNRAIAIIQQGCL